MNEQEIRLQDERAVGQALRGNKHAFDELVYRYHGMVFGLAVSRLRDRDAAEDLAQEVFLRAHLHLSKIEHPRYFSAWLVRVTRNLAVDWLSRGQRASQIVALVRLEGLPMETPDQRQQSPRQQAEEKEEERVLRQAVMQLPEQLRDVVLLHYAQGMSKVDIARNLGLNPSTVGRQLEKALELLRTQLEGRLRASVLPLRAPQRSAALASLLVATTAALSSTARAKLVAAAANTGAMSAGYAAGAGAAAGATGFLKAVGSFLATGKGMVATTAMAVVVATGVYHYQVAGPSVRPGARTPASSSVVGTGDSMLGGRTAPSVKRTLAHRSAGAAAAKPTPATRINVLPSAAPEDEALFSDSRLVVSGRVTLENGTPASSATVSLLECDFTGGGNPPRLVRETSASLTGDYRIAARHSPTVLAKAVQPGYACGLSLIVDSKTANMGRLVGSRYEARDFALSPAAVVRGRVIDEAAKPVTGAKVLAGFSGRGDMHAGAFSETVAGADGSFVVADLQPGGICLFVTSPHHMPARVNTLAPSRDVVVRLGSGGAGISGYAIAQSGGEGLSHATVILKAIGEDPDSGQLPVPLEAQSDDVGNFAFKHLPAGKYVIAARQGSMRLVPPEKEKGERPLSVTLDEGQQLDGVKLFLYPGHTVMGKVTEVRTGKPIEGAKVWSGMESAGYEATSPVVTDAKGAYCLEGVCPLEGGITFLNAEKEGYRIDLSNARSSNGLGLMLDPAVPTLKQDIQMARAVKVSGKVVTAVGQPVASALVTGYAAGDHSAQNEMYESDGNGDYAIEVLPNAELRVMASARGFAPSWSEDVQVGEEPKTGVNITMKSGATVNGTTVDTNGRPVAEVRIAVQTKEIRYARSSQTPGLDLDSAVSDTGGKFTLKNLPSEAVVLDTTKAGFAPTPPEMIRLADGEVKDGVKLVLGKSHFVAGRITGVDGQPVLGARVLLTGRNYARCYSDRDGRYRLDGLPEGTVDLLACQADGDGIKEVKGIHVDRSDIDIVLPSGAGPKKKEPPRGTIVGNVVDWRTSAPINDFTVRFGPYKEGEIERETSHPNQFIVRNVFLPSSPEFHIEAPGYTPLDTGYVPIEANKTVLEVTFQMGPGGVITGRVVQPDGQTAVADAKVEVILSRDQWRSPGGTRQTAQTGTDGRFRVEGVPQAKNLVIIQAVPPFAETRQEIAMEHAKSVDLGDIRLSGGARLTGKLVRMPGSVPVPDKKVKLARPFITKEQRETVTDREGRFEFATLAEAHYELTVPELACFCSLSIGEQEMEDVTLITGSGTIRGKVLRGGVPVEDGTVRLERDGDSRLFMQTEILPGGSFLFENVAAGEAVVVARLNSGANGRAAADVTEGGTAEITVTVNSGNLHGHVVDGDNRPIRGASVSIRGYSATSASDGSWRFSDQPPGKCAVSAGAEGIGLSLSVEATVPENADSEDVIIRIGGEGGTIVSSVLEASSGAPLKQAWCVLKPAGGKDQLSNPTRRGTDGIMVITGIPPGSYNVEVGANGYEEIKHPVEIKAGETVRLEDMLKKDAEETTSGK